MQKITTALLSLPLAWTTSALAENQWSYEGNTSPEHWGELSKQWFFCNKGMYQSPIDIRNPIAGNLPPLNFKFSTRAKSIINNGHTIQIAVEDGNSFMLDRQRWELKQFHFHTPSENHINGQSFPLEVHFVQANSDNELVVIAVMLVAGKANPALEMMLAALPQQQNQEKALNQPFSLESLFPQDKHYYRFSGSLTTPPCTEGVIWLVMKQPVEASETQLAHFAQALRHANNRPLQPLHGRQITQ
ncbi:carbonic anhydrase [Mixta theicola]|uniref:Carbonic anhydrase n=1 Tax=Mixta theicola TaxID=1458355 RepID=A0A2K1Q6Z6_9GAMM|nr:carbonic anhydrase family protein [Mixta theicola]PNS10834.1 carbonic anhydrase [Mixta theicola]GLR11200.1 carbonic anhydrase [Mixta theicola]